VFPNLAAGFRVRRSTASNSRAVVVGRVTQWKRKLLTNLYSKILFSVLRTTGLRTWSV
jgi:hypothetical protein